MDLNIWNIHDFLRYQGLKLQIKASYANDTFTGFRILDDAQTPSDENVLYVSDRVEEFGWSRKYGAVLLNRDTSIAVEAQLMTAINAVCRCTDHFEQWERRLNALMVKPNSIQQMLNETERLLPYQLLITNLNTKVVAKSAMVRAAHPDFEFADANGFLPPSGTKGMSDRTDSAAIYSSRSARYVKNQQNMFDRLRVNIWVNNRLSGLIVGFCGEKSFKKGDAQIMNVFCRYVTRYMEMHSHTYLTESVLGEHLVRYIETGVAEEVTFRPALSSMGWEEDQEYQCVRIESRGPSTLTPFVMIIGEQIQYIAKESCMFMYSDGITILLNRSKYDDCDKSISAIAEQLSGDEFVIGISYPFRGIKRVDLFYRQACRALDYGVQLGWSSPISASDIALGEISQIAKNDQDLASMIHPDVLELIAFDREHGSSLAKTLFCFLFCGCNYYDTAQLLDVHKNTVKYRVNKIRDLLSLNIDSENNRLLLLASFVLYGYNFS